MKFYEVREIKPSLLSLDLNECKLSDSGEEEEEEGKTFHKLHVLAIDIGSWYRVCRLGCEIWK